MKEGKEIWTGTAMGLPLFLTVCVCSAFTVKPVALVLTIGALSAAFLRFETLRSRMYAPVLALVLVVAMDGVSSLYAVAGKFALYEFLKPLAALSIVYIFLSFAPREAPGRWIASAVSACTALAGLVSIDLLSTRIISGAALRVLSLFTPDYEGLAGVEAGVRMTSLFGNPNIFAGCAGLGVLLGLGLASSIEPARPWERRVQLVLLSVNALAFVLVFSMGASGTIALAFLVLLFLERKERRGALLTLMAETLAVTLAGAAAVSRSSLQAWDGVRLTPLVSTVCCAAALCLLDEFVGRKLAGKLNGRTVPLVTACALAVLCAYAIAAVCWTGGADLNPGEGLRRSAYPEPGQYTLELAVDGPAEVTVESQNQRETMMHTSTILYQGPAEGASFTVLEDSLVVYFNFSAASPVRLEQASCTGEGGTFKIPLGYKLLPGFMANRLQGLRANENAIQRVVFFADGLKLFRRSPVIGLGMGAYENGIRSVQSFLYDTKYAHNHYIQVLVETGVVGLVLFLGLLGLSAASVWRELRQGGEADPLAPCLGAALVFMAGHGAVEVVFSAYSYLPLAFLVFALTGLCGHSWPQFGGSGKLKCMIAACVPLVVFTVLLACNLRAGWIAEQGASLEALEQAEKLDPFEWADYAMSYVDSVAAGGMDDPELLEKADKYALRLGKLDSNTVPIHLAEYYFLTGRTKEGLAMVRKYVEYVPADGAAWQAALDVLQKYEEDTETFRAGSAEIGQMLEDWNRENMGSVTVDEKAQAFLERVS